MSKKSKIIDIKSPAKKILPADDSFIVNEDRMLRPIRISLPDPPKLELIDGFNLPIEDQYFRRTEIPYKLKKLEERCVSELKEQDRRNKAFVITGFKLQALYWEILEKERKYFKDEIDFIKRCWWHRMNGYWFMNNGKPTYITGWHWMYLNFWYMPDVAGGHPLYRDADRKEFLFFDYSYKTKETFVEIDSDGFAMTDRYGNYVMKEMPNRVCYGVVEPKNRRAGDTSKGLCIGNEIASRTLGTDGFGIMSYTADNAEKHFKGKLVPAWNRTPMFFKPFSSSSNDPQSIVYNVASNEYGLSGLRTEITYAKTAESRYYDGKKLIAALLDEEGKTEQISIVDRWHVVQNCLSQGNGNLIHGWAYHPSTVEDYSEGGREYKTLADQSDFYRRNKNGQPFSGLFRIFVPAYERLDGYIDKYGMPIIETPRPKVQNEYGSWVEIGAYTYLMNKRNSYLKGGTPEHMIAYRSEQKQFPVEYSDCWIGTSGEVGFPAIRIDQRLIELDRLTQMHKSATSRYNLVWDTKDGSVIPVPDPEGRWYLSRLLKPHEANQKIKIWWIDPVTGDGRYVWRPMYPDKFVGSADPYDFATKSQMKIREGKSRMSAGSIAVFWKRDKTVDVGDIASEWESYRFVCTYNFRLANISEYYEDVIKTMVYFGLLLYPERNKTGLWQYIIERGYAEYLLYDVNPLTGMVVEKPGFYSLEGSKQELISAIKDYLDLRVEKENHADFLYQCKVFTGPEDLKNQDLLTACGGCLLGLRSGYAKMIEDGNSGGGIDLSGLANFFFR